MSNNLYDTGAPKKIIVEHHVIHHEIDERKPRKPASLPKELDGEVIDVEPVKQIEGPKK